MRLSELKLHFILICYAPFGIQRGKAIQIWEMFKEQSKRSSQESLRKEGVDERTWGLSYGSLHRVSGEDFEWVSGGLKEFRESCRGNRRSFR